MSAYILSDLHFSTIAIHIHHLNDKIGIQELADKLKSINIESVNYRYNEKTRKIKCKLQRDNVNYSTADIIRLVQCWSYQSCENSSSLDYQIMRGFLLSHFTEQEISDSQYSSDKWII